MKVIILFVLLLLPSHALAAGATGTLYKDPDCGCCQVYADYLRENGFDLTVVPTGDLAGLRNAHGVPEDLAGCHMTVINGYVVEGHVPVAMINRLLAERPDIRGISLPGMPMGSPGMTGKKTGAFTVLEIPGEKTDKEPSVYGVE